MHKGQILSHFRILDIEDIDEYKSTAIHLLHEPTGMEVFHLYNDDRENVFSFNFPTNPSDNSGVAHIVEHAVLAGSEKYRVKDPFVSLMKGSAQTFLNAMTYPDKTMYPAASPLEKDYFNLLSVYADAMFHPLLRREVFLQEGRRFEPAGNSYLPGGVVFNEMKGVYSNHDDLVGEYSLRSLFPETPYAFDSGGKPSDILKLSYEDFVHFHHQYYHPSNCKLFLYGNIPTEKQLEFLNSEVLHAYTKQDCDTAFPELQRWKDPQRFHFYGPFSEDDDGGSSIVMNWAVGSVLNSEDLLSMEILTDLLLSTAASPLQRAIVDSGLGEDLSPLSGIETDIREMIFVAGVRGAQPSKADELETVVTQALEKLVKDGFEKDLLEGTLNRFEFRQREIRGGYPFGLRLCFQTCKAWLYGADPAESLRFAQPMEAVRKNLEKNPRYFEEMVQQHLLDNSYRSTVIVEPKESFETDIEEEIQQTVIDLTAKLTEDDHAVLRDDFSAMEKFQSEADTTEALASIPQLHIDDLPKDIRKINTRITEHESIKIYHHELFTNGITYYDFSFDISHLSNEESMYLPLLSKALTSLGLTDMSYQKLSTEISRKTGGIYSYFEAGEQIFDKALLERFILRIKTLDSDRQDAIDLAKRILSSCDFQNVKRIKNIYDELKNDFKSAVIPSGDSVVSMRAGSFLHRILKREEQWRGIEQMEFLKSLKVIALDEIGQTLQNILEKILNVHNMYLNITAETEEMPQSERIALSILDVLGQTPVESLHDLNFEYRPQSCETFLGSSAVNFTAYAVPSASILEADSVYELLLANILTTEYLWEAVRMKGGAYGVNASTNAQEAYFLFTSYRDPLISQTLTAFKQATARVAENGVPADTLNQAILSLVAKELRPLSPGEESIIGFRRSVYQFNDDLRRRRRQQIISATVDDLKRCASRILDNWNAGVTVVLTGKQQLKREALLLPALNENVHKLL